MRSGGGAAQQALAADAAAVTREAVSLARRRGHAQVTPLHVASAMLADAGGGLLRAACVRARPGSQPLQCKALELCLNVALNRLATAGPPAVFFPFHHPAPALSNALAAAFKRAQANQRRSGGSASAEAQQAAKVELEQLVVSILDDPSVNRVMREAGFSGAEVKACLEKPVSSEHSSNTANSSSASPSPNPRESKAKVDVAGDDATRVLDCMASGAKRSVVVVGENAAAAEGVIKAVMHRVRKGELQRHHERLRNLHFAALSAASFRRMAREEVEARAGDLRALVREGRAAGKGVVLVLEDLGYAADAWAAALGKSRDHGNHHYCPVAHAVMELSSMVRDDGRADGRDGGFWLLGFGTYLCYASCRAGQPSLEAVLELHPVDVPGCGLGLSLGGASELAYCGADRVTAAAAATVPSWLRRGQGPVLTGSELTLSLSSHAASSTSGFTHYDANPSSSPWHDLVDRRQPWPSHRHDVPMVERYDGQLLIYPSYPGSSSSVSKANSSEGAREPAARRRPKFTELTAENLRILCDALETRVPRHRDVAPSIASAVLRRRSGVTRTARPGSATWLLFQGRDIGGKTAMARELARLVFGSYAGFASIAPTELTTPAHAGSSSGGELGLKRQRPPENEHGCVQRLYEAILENPHRVVLIDGVERSDDDTEAGIKNAIATGTVRGCNGGVVRLEDAIVVLSFEAFESRSRALSPRRVKQRVMADVDGEEEEGGTEKGAMQPRFSLDLNAGAVDAEGEEEGSSHDDVEILDVVDGVFFFRC
ncbi:hypothetical protein ACP70R_020477 [Stipagrostis hirtigluma subsp. patula]